MLLIRNQRRHGGHDVLHKIHRRGCGPCRAPIPWLGGEARVRYIAYGRYPHPGLAAVSLPEGEGQGEGNPEVAAYADIPKFCKSATLEEIRGHGYELTPGRYVGVEAQQDDGESFEEKMQRLVPRLLEEQAEAPRLDEAIWKNLKELGYGG